MLRIQPMSSTAKAISCLLTIPLVGVAVLLFWSGHESMFWVLNAINLLLPTTGQIIQADKLGFLIVLLVVGIPALLPCYLHDYLNKKIQFNFRYSLYM